MGWEDRPYHREDSYDGGGGARSLRFLLPRTRLGIALIVSNVLIFIIQAVTGPVAGLSPIVTWGRLSFQGGVAFTQPWRWITYQYIHADGSHLFWNMVGLYFFVPVLEQMWGWKRTILFYTLGGIAAGATFGLMSLVYPTGGLVGASGSLLSVIGAIAVLAPDMQVLLIVIPMTMRTLAILYAVLYLFTIVGDRNMSDAAHLGGLAFGAAFVAFGSRTRGLWEGRIAAWKKGRQRRQFDRERDEQADIDAILAKVSAKGMQSLSWRERRTLKQATERQRQRDLELARGRSR